MKKNIININNIELILKIIHLKYQISSLASSFSIEDVILIFNILKKNFNINIFTLDTGFIHKETIKIIKLIKKFYNYNIIIYKYDLINIQKFIIKYGLNAFYNNIKIRKKCCYLRKVDVLKKYILKNYSWITGMRKEQSITRKKLKLKEYDKNFNILKFNPLFNFKLKNIWKYIEKNNILYNKLYDKGYSSIGCSPCTKPTKNKKNIRLGRWWWEKSKHKECGLHIK